MCISLYVSINDQRAIRLKPAFVACQLGDFDSLAEMILNQEIFGSLTIPTSEERILCLNATESAIREQTFLHLAAFYGHLDIAQLFCSFPEINLEGELFLNYCFDYHKIYISSSILHIIFLHGLFFSFYKHSI